jgi:hypothetical protein
MSSYCTDSYSTPCFSLRSYVLALTGTVLALHTFSLFIIHRNCDHVASLHTSVKAVSCGLFLLSLLYRIALVRALYTKHVSTVRFLINLEAVFFAALSLFVGASGMTMLHLYSQNEGRTYVAVALGMVVHGLIYTLPLWRYMKALMKESTEAKVCDKNEGVPLLVVQVVDEKATMKNIGGVV